MGSPPCSRHRSRTDLARCVHDETRAAPSRPDAAARRLKYLAYRDPAQACREVHRAGDLTPLVAVSVGLDAPVGLDLSRALLGPARRALARSAWRCEWFCAPVST